MRQIFCRTRYFLSAQMQKRMTPSVAAGSRVTSLERASPEARVGATPPPPPPPAAAAAPAIALKGAARCHPRSPPQLLRSPPTHCLNPCVCGAWRNLFSGPFTCKDSQPQHFFLWARTPQSRSFILRRGRFYTLYDVRASTFASIQGPGHRLPLRSSRRREGRKIRQGYLSV